MPSDVVNQRLPWPQGANDEGTGTTTFEFGRPSLAKILKMCRAAIESDAEDLVERQSLAIPGNSQTLSEDSTIIQQRTSNGVNPGDEVKAQQVRLSARFHHVGLTLSKIQTQMIWRYGISGLVCALSIWAVKSFKGQIRDYLTLVVWVAAAYTSYGIFGLICLQRCQRKRNILSHAVEMGIVRSGEAHEMMHGWEWSLVIFMS